MPEIISIRASSLPDLCDCPARWEAKHIKGLRLPTSAAAILGTAVHAGAAAYDASVMTGEGLTIDDAAGAVVDAIAHPTDDVDWGDDNPRESETIALALHGLYCREVSPIQTYVAVEAACERLEIPEIGIALTGTTDRVRRDPWGNLGIADIKTGRSAVGADGSVRTAGHAAQIAVYELLAGVALGEEMTAPAQIIGLQVAKTPKGRRAGIGEIVGARDMLVGTDVAPGILQIASNMLHSGLFYGNPRSSLCSKKYCPAYDVCRWRR